MGRKRDRLKIIYDILKVIQDRNNRILHTHILYKANLSYPILQNYLQELIFKDLVKKYPIKNKHVYGLTDKGFEYLHKYNLVKDFTTLFDLEANESRATEMDS